MTARLFRNARLPDGRVQDLAVREGRFVAQADASFETLDLTGLTILPGLVDGHIHLDKSFVGDRWRPHEPASSLRGRLAIEKRLLAQAPPVADRAEALIAQAHSFGTIAMRSHVDVDATTGLASLHAVMAAREKWKGRVEIELVAFPQAGVVSCPGTAELLEAAIADGAEVVGGIDPTTLDGAADEQLDIVFGIAERRGAKIDIHLHEPGALGIEQLQRIAARTMAGGLAGRVAVSHAYALGEVTLDAAARTAETLAKAGVAIMTNAPGGRPFPPVGLLRAAGVRVFSGSDNIRDAWWPYGEGDMLRRAMLVGYGSHFNTDDELLAAMDLCSGAAAQVLGFGATGFEPGRDATFLIVEAPCAAAAVAAPPAERRLVLHGEIQPPIRSPVLERLLAT